ncbi:HAD family hydrolase [Nanoarchaeota archaeon]
MVRGIIFDWVGTLYERDKGLFPFSEGILRGLKPRYKLGLVSKAGNGVANRVEELKSTGIVGYFDSVVVDTDKGERQFTQCMNEMGTIPENTIVVGDRASREIQTGNQLGCETYWIQVGDRSSDSPNEETGQATKVIDSIEDLLEVLE